MKKRYRFLIGIAMIGLIGYLIPEPKRIPVLDATSNDWNADTFWYEPWGSSGVHKGIDIFAKNDTPVLASSNLMLLFKGNISKGGKVIVGLGSKWRLHYFAHLESIEDTTGVFVASGTQIGRVGTSGNANGKPPHLHYSLVSLLPQPWLIDSSNQGYKKAFYLNPIQYFLD